MESTLPDILNEANHASAGKYLVTDKGLFIQLLVY